MSERALSDLLIRQGVEAGLPVDQVVEQLAEVKFPPFVNIQEYRATLFEAAEGHLRSEYEARLAALRQKVYSEDATPPANGLAPPPAEEPADVAGHVLQTTPPAAPSTAAMEEDDMDVFAAQETAPEPAGAADETAIWVTSDGAPVRRQYPAES